eukprot:m.236453 g.236453  ORF g.236453 m.236453 type:complete len:580 (-) comp17098_c5_seq1:667-2406(-)
MADIAAEKRVDECASELNSLSSDISELKRRLANIRAQMFKVEMLRARRKLKEAQTSGEDELKEGLEQLSLQERQAEENRMEAYKYRGRGRMASAERLQSNLAALSEMRFSRWSEERGLGSPRHGGKKSQKVGPQSGLAPLIPGQIPALPALGALRDVPELSISAANLTSSDQDVLTEEIVKIRRALSKEQQPPIQEVIDGGYVPYLLHLLTHPDQKVQFEAAWALTNIASGSSDQTRVLIDLGAVPLFVYLLRSPVADICDQAIWALGNISGDCAEYRDLCLRHEIMPVLVNIIRSSGPANLMRNAVWCMSNLCRGKPRPDFRLVSIAIPVLARLAEAGGDQQALSDALWALSYLSDGSNEQIQAVLECLPLRRLVELTLSASNELRTPSLRTLGNIVTGDDRQTQACLDAGFLVALKTILMGGQQRSHLLKEACWALSNITAGTAAQIQAVLDAELLPAVVAQANSDNARVVKEAIWVLSNITSGGSPQQIAQLMDERVMTAFAHALQMDPSVKPVAIEGLANITNTAASSPNPDTLEHMYELMSNTGLIDAIQDDDNPHAQRILSLFGELDEEESDN